MSNSAPFLDRRLFRGTLRVLTVTVAAALCTIPARGTGLRPVTFDDYAKMVRVSDPQISSNGKEVAFVVTRTDMTSNDRKSEIDVVDLASGATRSLTYGRDHVEAPRWSPDGTQLAFVTLPSCDQPCKPKPQVFAFPMN